MKLCINRAILAGAIGRDGVEIRYNERGTAHANFMLVLTDVGQDGREHATWIPCEVWGKGAESAGELEAGQCVCFEGKLRREVHHWYRPRACRRCRCARGPWYPRGSRGYPHADAEGATRCQAGV